MHGLMAPWERANNYLITFQDVHYHWLTGMKRYKNINGNSGVSAYETGDDFIVIEFGKNATYLYNYKSAGRENIETMKILAVSGKGLSTFISRHVKNRYASQLK